MYHSIYFIMLSIASFITCSAYESEEAHVDLVSGKAIR
jgi:hypothetical protein